MLTFLLGAVLLLALVRMIHQIAKAPHDRPLRAVAYCIVCASLSFPIGLRSVVDDVDGMVGAGTSKLIQNILLLGTVYWLMCFYLQSASDPSSGRRRARIELIPLAITAVVITAATLATPRSERGHVYATANMQVASIAVFYLAAGIYLAYALAMALRWTLRYIRVSRGSLTVGLRLVAVSLTCMVGADALRGALVVVRALDGTVPTAVITGVKLLLDLAIPLFVVGILYPGAASRLASLRLRWRHRRTHHRLTPLWVALHEAFPENALHRAASDGWRSRLTPQGVHHRYYRRVIECRDGIVRLSPYLTQLKEAGPVEHLPPRVVADHLNRALEAYAAGTPAPSGAVAIALPQGDDLDDDVRQLVLLSDALRASRPA
ncbi:MAB_1171c family putative transporter [Streptomyces sp. NPDC059818]|uniref:MAB_1171c family putative transporter n=1 Tax=Streptomyces sp. NPDC059818 TaxID=3346962 RepID=UPI0036610270